MVATAGQNDVATEKHHIEMSVALHATYDQMARGELNYEDGIAKLIQIGDKHIAACKKVLNERRGGPR